MLEAESRLYLMNPMFQIGPNLNNPTLPIEWQKSPNARRFELPPTTTIGIVDHDNTISQAPPLAGEPLAPLKYTPKWTKGKSVAADKTERIARVKTRHLSVPPRQSPQNFLITSPNLLNKTLSKPQNGQCEVPFVSNYHVPKQN